MQIEKLDVSTLKGGAFLELVNREIQRCLDDIANPMCEAKSKRTVTATIEFIPTEDASFGAVVLRASSKLGKQKPAKTSLSFGHRDGRGVASEKMDVSQVTLFETPVKDDQPIIDKTAN